MKPNSLTCKASVVVLMAALLCMGTSAASVRVSDPSTPAMLLAQVDQLSSSDHSRFLGILKQLHQVEKQLTPAQRWHLTLLDALRWIYAAKDAEAIPLLHDVIDHSGDPSLSARATAALIQADFASHHYEQAYVLAGSLIASLPNIPSPVARREVLDQVVLMMNEVGQYDLALKYARQIKASFLSAKGQCLGMLLESQTLAYAGKLDWGSPEYKDTIDTCLAAHQIVYANALRLDMASQLVAEGHADRAIGWLHQIAPSIRKSEYQPHIASLSITLAQASLRKGSDNAARKYALTALAEIGPGSSNWVVQAADKVLYQVEKQAGHASAALSYYEKYVARDKASASNAEVQALAYQEVKQEVVAKKMSLDALSKQNSILKLRQALENQAQETSRLYIALLLLVIAFIATAMFWLRRSQLRFRKMARHDGLTGVFNREHFFETAGHTLRRLHRAGAGACLAVLDMDHFKRVNDTYGHAAGDEVLRQTVAVCRQELRGSDVFGRLGGEEFGILMPTSSREQGVEIATRILRSLAATPMVLNPDTTIRISASFGLAWNANCGRTLRELLIDADAALYRAKDGGRNQVVMDTRADPPPEDPKDALLACNV